MPWYTRQDLVRRGYTRSAMQGELVAGRLVRVRRGHYCTPDADPAVTRAVRVGGYLTCVSELRRRGVWVLDGPEVHVRVPPNAGRLRPDEQGAVLHWGRMSTGRHETLRHVSAVEAVIDALGCLPPRSALASIDSALHIGVLRPEDIGVVRRQVAVAHRRLLDLADLRAESGLESIVRMLAIDLGLRARPQVAIGSLARVDLLVEERVIVETDGDAFHDEKVTTKDRRRDAALVALGFTVLRFRYAQVVFELESVAKAIVAAVATHRGIPNSGRLAARARRRVSDAVIS